MAHNKQLLRKGANQASDDEEVGSDTKNGWECPKELRRRSIIEIVFLNLVIEIAISRQYRSNSPPVPQIGGRVDVS